jgi:signal transduction histidine kinase
MGLRIMRERLDGVGASLEVESAPGHGTTVTVVWQDPVGSPAPVEGAG